MLSLKSIARADRTPDTLKVRGRDVPARLLSGYETDVISAVFDRPAAPKRPTPGKGSLAPWQPDEDDPAYKTRHNQWIRRQQVLTIAVALGWETAAGLKWDPDGDAASNRDFAMQAVNELCREFSHAELVTLYTGVLEIERRAAGLGDPEGKEGPDGSSPTPSGPAMTGGPSPSSTQ